MSSKFAMDFGSLLSKIESVTTKKTFEKDENLWKPTKDKAGNAAAIIRFLPSKNIDDLPFVRMYKHNFQDAGTKRWYIENSLTTIGGQDMVSTINKELWNTGIKENKELSSLRKRKLTYIANILVIKDLGNPENNGKVMKYAFGAKIFEKIQAAMNPSEDLGEEPISVFCPINGADFLLKMQFNESTKQFNYDASKFNSKKPISNDDDTIEEILSRCFDVTLEIAPDKFKTEKELADKFLWVTGQKDNQTSAPSHDDDVNDEINMLAKMSIETPKTRKTPAPVQAPVADTEDDDAFFKSLIED